MQERSIENARRAFVTGGSGFVGGRLIRRLLAEGWAVHGLGRSDEALRKIAALGAQPVRGDLSDARALESGMTGCEVVFHAAAHFKLWGPAQLFEHVNVEGARSLIAAAKKAPGVRRVVMVSAAAVVMGPPEDMRDVQENAPLRFLRETPYSSSKARAEELVLAANGSRAGFETIAMRPPFIWGAGMPTLEEMIHTVQAGRFQWVDGGNQAMSRCHVDNLCHALILAADKGRPGEAYFVSDGENGTLKSIVGGLLETRDVHPGDKAVPFATAWGLAGAMAFVWRAAGLRGEPPITRQMLRLIGKDFTISIDKARRDLGYTPIVDWAAGVAEMRRSAQSKSPHLAAVA